MTKIINLYGGPGTGKSTTAAGVFYTLKQKGVSCELVTEFAKDLTWDESYIQLRNPIYVFAEQHHRLFRLDDKVDYIVTDSPLLLSVVYNKIYGELSEVFDELVFDQACTQDAVHIYLNRVKPYVTAGRNETFEQACNIDLQIKRLLEENVEHYTVTADQSAINGVLDIIGKRHD